MAETRLIHRSRLDGTDGSGRRVVQQFDPEAFPLQIDRPKLPKRAPCLLVSTPSIGGAVNAAYFSYSPHTIRENRQPLLLDPARLGTQVVPEPGPLAGTLTGVRMLTVLGRLRR